jgi:hypothetical protein
VKLRHLAFLQDQDGHRILDVLDEHGQEAAMRALVDYSYTEAEESGIEDDTRDLPGLPDLPGYRSFEGGNGYLVQYHWGMGHVALYAWV